MAKHVAFIRAINVAGHARVKMDAVKAAFVAAGCNNVATLIQSGNVLFDAPERQRRRIEQSVRELLRRLVGEEATVLFRTVRQIGEIVQSRPFGDVDADPAIKLYVVFLARSPSNRPSFPLRSEKEALAATHMQGLEVFVVSRRKTSGFYGFPNNFIEQQLGVAATSRNWSTVSKIARLADH
jgi:uncharacterized protein (DUF1697 family)